MGVLAFGFFVTLATILAFEGRSRAGSGGNNVKSPYNTNSWAPVVIPLATAAGLPPLFVLKWIEVESDGNPCAFGSPGAKGPDGNPREIGLAQLYNPDDFRKLGVDPGKLRAYCVPGSQQCARMLTAAEMTYHVNAVLKLILASRATAAAKLSGVGATWRLRDTYRATKMVHALPGVLNSGLPAVTAHLGRPPESWEEFRDNLDNVKLDPGTEHYRPFTRLLVNAEETGNAVADDEVT